MSEIPAEQARPQDETARLGAEGLPDLLAIANSVAGSAHEEAVAEAMTVLRARADVELVLPADVDELRAAVEVLGDRRLVVLGGDGTVHECVNALARLGRLDDVGPVGLVPLGTGNDLARALGIPDDDPGVAAQLAVDGVPRSLELLRADDGSLVVNAVHAGVGAEAAEEAHEVKHRLGAVGYAVGAVRAGAEHDAWRLRVTVDDRVLHDGSEPVLMVAVGVGSSIGGGAPVAPDAEPEDGLAEVVVSTATGPLARVGYALAVRRGEHTERDDVVSDRGRVVTVEALDADSAFRTDTDGEVEGPFMRRSWTLVPRAWQALAPPP